MSKEEEIYKISVIISARKSVFLTEFWEEYKKNISAQNRNFVYSILVEIISNLNNDLFIGKQEKMLGVIDKNLSLKELRLNAEKIKKQIEKELKSHQ